MSLRALLLTGTLSALAVPALCAAPDGRARVLGFVPPASGTYELHRIMKAPDGPVLTVDGGVARLSQLTGDRITLLGFMYTSCMDPEGCPLAYRVFAQLEGAGVRRRSLYLAGDFTVASLQGLSGRMLHMRDDAYAALGSGVPGFSLIH